MEWNINVTHVGLCQLFFGCVLSTRILVLYFWLWKYVCGIFTFCCEARTQRSEIVYMTGSETTCKTKCPFQLLIIE